MSLSCHPEDASGTAEPHGRECRGDCRSLDRIDRIAGPLVTTNQETRPGKR